ncbi:hypothetical protein Efla_007093 [Eimeria flavescens]
MRTWKSLFGSGGVHEAAHLAHGEQDASILVVNHLAVDRVQAAIPKPTRFAGKRHVYQKFLTDLTRDQLRGGGMPSLILH